MTIIKLDISSCDGCPNLSRERYYTGDSFEHVMEWKCKKKNKRISLVETFDKNPLIPSWCPLRVD